MADALVSVVLQHLTSILEAEIQQEGRPFFGGQEEVQKLTTIWVVLNDAEKKRK